MARETNRNTDAQTWSVNIQSTSGHIPKHVWRAPTGINKPIVHTIPMPVGGTQMKHYQ